MRWVVNATSPPIYPREIPIVQGTVSSPGPIWTSAENLAPTGIRSPGRPALSESLYRLNYPGLPVRMRHTNMYYVFTWCVTMRVYSAECKNGLWATNLKKAVVPQSWHILFCWLYGLRKTTKCLMLAIVMIKVLMWNIPNKNLERCCFATCWVTFQICICVLWSTWPDKIRVFWNVTPCILVDWYECSRRACCWPKKGGSTSIQKVTAMY